MANLTALIVPFLSLNAEEQTHEMSEESSCFSVVQ